MVGVGGHRLARTGGRRALVTMCIGGGQGLAAVLERDDDATREQKKEP